MTTSCAEILIMTVSVVCTTPGTPPGISHPFSLYSTEQRNVNITAQATATPAQARHANKISYTTLASGGSVGSQGSGHRGGRGGGDYGGY